MRPPGRRQGSVRSALEARRRTQHRSRHHTHMVPSASPGADTADLLESLVFDVFVVAGVLAVFGVVALIAKGVERL